MAAKRPQRIAKSSWLLPSDQIRRDSVVNAEGLQHGDHDGGDDPGGKTYVIQGVTFVGIMNMGG